MKNTRPLLISFATALFAVLLIFSYVKQKEKTWLDMSTPVQVVVATKNISQGTRLDDSNMELRNIPKKFVQPGALHDLESVYDQEVASPVLAGTQLLEPMLASQQLIGLSQKIPKDMVGYTVAVNNVTGVAALLQPGDYVDVLLTVDVGTPSPGGETLEQETLAKVVLENLLILAVDQRSTRQAINSGYTPKSSNNGNIFKFDQNQEGITEVATVTVAVTDDDCLKLNLAQEIGAVSLALRSKWSAESKRAKTTIDSYELLGVDKPVLPKSTPSWVEIRGADKSSRY